MKTPLFFLISLTTLTSFAQTGYVIKGKVGTLSKPAKAYLTYQKRGDTQPFFDSTYLDNGQFTFTGKVGYPKEAHIRVVHDDKPLNPLERPVFDALPLLLEDTVITITAKDSVNNATITGSKVNDENARVTAMLKPYYDKYKVLDNEYRKQPLAKQSDPTYIKTLEERAAVIQKTIISVKMDYVHAHPNEYMALMAFNSTLPPTFDAQQAEVEFLKLSPAVRRSDLGQTVEEKIATVKKTQEGAVAPDFTLPDTTGKLVKLSDFRGKYVLIDFWASWCAPCRRENPNLTKAYAQFKNKGFEILGVSLDKPDQKAKWLQAIAADGLTWTQVSDLKAWSSEVAKLYEVNAIPMNFLLDKDGKIIAKYLRGEALTLKLSELLGK